MFVSLSNLSYCSMKIQITTPTSLWEEECSIYFYFYHHVFLQYIWACEGISSCFYNVSDEKLFFQCFGKKSFSAFKNYLDDKLIRILFSTIVRGI